MGFQHKAKRIRVAFEEGHEYHGFEVTLRKLNLEEYLSIMNIGVDKAKYLHVGDQLSRMGDKLISWNLEDEHGNPVPATKEELLRQDFDLMMAVLNGWLDGVNGVTRPLPQSSSDGEPSLEESIPMETPSESLAS